MAQFPTPSPVPTGAAEPGSAAPAPVAAFTGRERVRTTRASVKVVNTVMKYLICTGGISVVLVFAGIMAFIAYVVLPLFFGADLQSSPPVALSAPAPSAPHPADPAGGPTPSGPAPAADYLLAAGLDLDLTTLWQITAGGQLRAFCLADGRAVHTENLANQPITGAALSGDRLVIAAADGTVRFGAVKVDTTYLNPADLPPGRVAPQPGQRIPWDGGVAELTRSRQIRVVKVTADLSDPTRVGDEPAAAVVAVDYEFEEDHESIAALRADGRLYLETITKRTNMMTGKVKLSVRHHELPTVKLDPAEPAPQLFLGLNAKQAYLLRADGRCRRINLEDPDNPIVAEDLDLLPDPSRHITAARWLNGRQTIIVADSDGGVAGWFAAPRLDEDHTGADRLHFVQAHLLAPQTPAAVAVASSVRDRQFVTVDPQGGLVIRHMTSGSTQGQIAIPLTGGAGASAHPPVVAMAPGNNAIAVVEGLDNLHLVHLHNPHADGSWSAMFSKLWYEGYPGPAYVYQSSAGTDDAEPKYSMVPLIFGTLKATFYAMLFSIPIAVLAAIFTSEFMHPRTRNTIKPVVEMMASLPSVVLGFVAAQVLAPIVGANLVGVLLAIGLIPAALFTVGFIWQLLPGPAMRRVLPWQRFALMFVTVLAALWLAWQLGPVVEGWYFGGDIKTWLAGSGGSAIPGWLFLLMPLCFIGLSLFYTLRLQPGLAIYRTKTSNLKFGAFELSRGAGLLVGAFLLALLFAKILAAAGFDVRGVLTSAYVERNSLVLGMIMGFAIIPIIYTVSEDALSSVPNTLRSASLGMGATPWQTAIRVVLPVAFPGVFSACMIGLGRAAGETMIVLMASGRTPLLDLSPFNGLSALSANIATELPEAPKDSTHYRMLFVSAVILFIVTFVVNTAAEMVRLRYRKRAAHL